MSSNDVKRMMSALWRIKWQWFALPLALLMLAVMLMPASVWHQPEDDASYQGFDANLLYISPQSYPLPEQGIIKVTEESLQLTALRDSQPSVQLLTTPFKELAVSLDVRILESTEGTEPLKIGVWSPRATNGFFVEFGPPPINQIQSKIIVDGGAAQTLVEGTVLRAENLATYSTGQSYHLEFQLDKNAGVITSHLSSLELPPVPGSMLRLAGGPADSEYKEIISAPVPVEEGEEYTFGGTVKVMSGGDAYKIVLQWLDKDLNFLGATNDWRAVMELSGWTDKSFTGIAPAGAEYGRLNLGSGNGTELLYAALFLREATGVAPNLLNNGDLQEGTKGWMLGGDPSVSPEIVDPRPISVKSSVTSDELPELFESLRLAFTASASSRSGRSDTVLENYSVTLPHQKWQVMKIADTRAIILVSSLVGIGIVLVVVWVIAWLRARSRRKQNTALIQPTFGTYAADALLPRLRTSAWILLAVLAFLLLNVMLFNLGNLPFDMIAEKVWAYVAVNYGYWDIYHLPNLVSLAKVWGGTPYHEAVFPYHPVMAYVSTIVGWLYRLVLAGPEEGFRMDSFGLEFVIKSFNVLFALADAVLIYLISRRVGIDRKWGLVAAGIFLFNPAVWFSTSIWGQTHVISLFFLLLAVWMMERDQPMGAWLSLAACALTRPQMLVPGFILAVVLLRRVPLRENVLHISWAVILAFILLSPYSLTIGPSLSLDLLVNQMVIQEGGGNEPAMTTVSLDAYSVWPLMTYLVDGARGLDRIFYPSNSPLIGSMTYLRVSQILTSLTVLGSAVLIAVRRRENAEKSGYLQIMAMGTIGFLMLKTGLGSAHFLIGLPLLILCRNALKGPLYLAIVGIWTLTTLVPMYGSLGHSISSVPALAPALHAGSNPVTQFFVQRYSSDWFITLASALNLVVFVGLLAIAVYPVAQELRRRLWRRPIFGAMPWNRARTDL